MTQHDSRPESPNDVLTADDVAEILRCSIQTVHKLAKSNRLKSVSLTTGGKRGLPRFVRKNVMAFLNGDSDDSEEMPEPKPKPSATKPKNVQLKRHSIMGIEP